VGRTGLSVLDLRARNVEYGSTRSSAPRSTITDEQRSLYRQFANSEIHNGATDHRKI